MADFMKKHDIGLHVLASELQLQTESEKKVINTKIEGYLRMKEILNGQSYSRPYKHEYDDACWLITSPYFSLDIHEKRCLAQLIEAFMANEAMLSGDYREAKFLIADLKAKFDDF